MSRAREVSKIVETVDLVENSIDNIDLSSTITTASAAAVDALVNGAPGALDTLLELSQALNDDPNFYNTIANVYLSQSSASTTYLNQNSASSTYLSQTNAQNTYVAKNGANYAVSNASATTVNSTTPTTIASVNLTTSGRPVLLVGSGDMNPTTAAPNWNRIAFYRGNDPVGKRIICESTGSSVNNPWALTHIDTPPAGTYNYTIKAYQGAGTQIYGEEGAIQAPTLVAIELF